MNNSDKAKIIVEAYSLQTDIRSLSEKFSIPENVISKTLQLHNIKGRREKTHENLKEGEKLRVINFEEDYNFLDKYSV